MAKRKTYPLRLSEDILAAMQRWGEDELRSTNAQIEYILRNALVTSGRVKLIQKVVTEVQQNDDEDIPGPS